MAELKGFFFPVDSPVLELSAFHVYILVSSLNCNSTETILADFFSRCGDQKCTETRLKVYFIVTTSLKQKFTVF